MDDFVLDVDFFPLVVTVVPSRVDIASIDAYLSGFERAVLGRHAYFTSVLDMSRLGHVPEGRSRRRAAEWSAEWEEVGRRWNCGMALVTPSPIARAAMRSIQLLLPPVIPTVFVATIEEGVRYAVAQLDARGVPHAIDVEAAIAAQLARP